MKPYYQQDGITIYHGDCRGIVTLAGAVDYIITDPPYGIEYQSNHRTPWQRLGGIQNDDEMPQWLFSFPASRAKFICCRWDNLRDIPQPKSFIVWDKLRHGMGDLEHEWGRQWEAMAFYAEKYHAFTRRPIDIIRVACVPPGALVHPNEKPPELFSPILVSHPKGLILDPYCGTGPVLQAAKSLGWPAIGIEIEEKYCEIAANRLAQGVLITV